MKKMMTALVALFAFVASASAMSYEQARQQALFLTDKMAYELNLTEEQYEAAYEVNLDYLMGVNTQDDLYGLYWERRNMDLSYILLDWQYRMYLDATYFYRPLYWSAGYWHFGIYARYPHRDYFYFGVPRFYSVYRGGHAWHHNGGRSWYHGRSFAPVGRGRNDHFGMHNRFERGDYGRGNRGFGTQHHGNGNFNNGNFNNGNYSNRGSNRPGGVGNDGNRNLGGGHRQHNGYGTMQAKPNTQGPAMGSQQNRGNFNNQHGSYGGSRPSSTRTTGRQFEGNSRSNSTTAPRSTFTPSRSVRSVGSPSRSSAPSRSISPSRSSSSRSVGAPTRSSAPSRSFSAPSRSSSSSHSSMGSSRSGGSHGGGASRGGGGHFGGRR